MTVEKEFVDFEYIKSNILERRKYQVNLVNSALNESSVIVLPTGTGKTPVAIMVAAKRLSECDVNNKRVLMLAPKLPLVKQHADDFREFLTLPDHEVKVFTGETRPEKREELWGEPASIVLATPQVIENDLIAGRISLENVVYLVFDECHHAVGDYPYTYISERYWQQSESPLVTGLSASPGSDEEEVINICENVGATNVEVLTEDDEELKEYFYETELQEEKIKLDGPFDEISSLLQGPYTEVLKELKDIGVLNTRDKSRISERKLQSARGRANNLIENDDSDGYRAQSLISEARKFLDAINSVETRGMNALKSKFDKWEKEADMGKSKAVKRFLNRKEVKKARRVLRENENELHPKMKVARSHIINTHMSGGRTIVFTESRVMAAELADIFTNKKINAHKFVGQSDTEHDEGMSQKEQSHILTKFREGEIDVLVATSVAEEGLDIPSVDLVLFYEPVASTIRSVQRRGRTGRETTGKVVVLMTKNSRDMGAYYASKKRESTMKKDLKNLKDMEDELNERLGSAQSELSEFDKDTADTADVIEGKVENETNNESKDIDTKDDFVDDDNDDIVIYCDDRELKSTVARELSKHPSVDLRTERLEVGDYIVSDRCAIERKTAQDFVDTLTGDRDLFSQVSEAKNEYEKTILLFECSEEGSLDEFYSHGVHPNAVRGVFGALVLGLGVFPLFSRSESDTAELLFALAKREQEERDREVSLHGSKTTKGITEQQEYIVSSIADVGPVTARNLLKKFGSVKKVMNASKEELTEVENVGDKTAEKIINIITHDYS